MTDDKAIEAALDAYYSALEWRKKPETYMHDMRAAIAAADKVRAEGFDFGAKAADLQFKMAELFSFDEGVQQKERDTISEFLRGAFAAGLAKGEADRAALVEALDEILSKAYPDRMTRREMDASMGEIIDICRAALAPKP